MAKVTVPGVTDVLNVDLVDSVATITLDRPQVLNALTHDQRNNLELTFKALDADPAVRVMVLRGAGRAFCAGQDQRESASLDAAGASRRIEAYASLYTTMRRLGKPVIARMHGYATGAGLQLALLSDLRIAAEDAKFGMTELNVGSAAIMGSAFLVAIIGEAAMRRMVLMSDFIGATEALSINLVHEVHAPEAIDARVKEIAARLTTHKPSGIAMSKEWWRVMGEKAFNETMDYARTAHARNFADGHFSAGSSQFVSRPKA